LERKLAVVSIESEHQNVIKTEAILLKSVGYKGIVNDNNSIFHGKAKKGKFMGKH
jgi:hypothetical protein